MQNEKAAIVSLGELLAGAPEDMEFLVEGMLVKGGFGLLAGKPKAGKSTLARVLAYSVAKGIPFLGFPVRQGPVLYYGLEEKDSEVRRHFEELGADGSEPIFLASRPPSGKQENSEIRTAIKKYQASLVIIDPLFRAVKVRDSSAYAEVSTALEPLLYLARDSGAHILCVHHLGKGGRSGADSILGSTAIRGAFDVNLLLNKTEQHRSIQSENRYGEALEETILVQDPDTKLISLGGAKAEVSSERVEKEFLAILSRSPALLTQQELEAGVNARTEWKRYALRKLLEAGRITRTGTGRRGDKFKYSLACSAVPGPASGTQEQESK